MKGKGMKCIKCQQNKNWNDMHYIRIGGTANNPKTVDICWKCIQEFGYYKLREFYSSRLG